MKACSLVTCAEGVKSCFFSGKRDRLEWRNTVTLTWQTRSWLRSRLERQRNFRDWQTSEKHKISSMRSRCYTPVSWLARGVKGYCILILWIICCDSALNPATAMKWIVLCSLSSEPHLNYWTIFFRKMKAVVQRVLSGSVRVEGEIVASIGKGFVALIGIHRFHTNHFIPINYQVCNVCVWILCRDDTKTEMEYIVRKLLGLR